MPPLRHHIANRTTCYIPVSVNTYKYFTIRTQDDGFKVPIDIGLATYDEVQKLFREGEGPKKITIEQAQKALDYFNQWIGNAYHYLENPPGTKPNPEVIQATLA